MEEEKERRESGGRKENRSESRVMAKNEELKRCVESSGRLKEKRIFSQLLLQLIIFLLIVVVVFQEMRDVCFIIIFMCEIYHR